MNERIPILFDTDIGSDIDDAVALAYLLKEPRAELAGVTTVTGDVEKRSRLAGFVAEAAGMPELPIHSGLSDVLLFGPGQPDVPQYDAIKDLPHRKDYPADAIDFMRSTIRSRPGEITLLGVGPLTNIGALFASDPEIPSLLKRLVLMCGVYTAGSGHGPGSCEWNSLADPIASAIVYDARPERFLCVGLEVSMKCTLEAGECRSRFVEAGTVAQAVLKLAEVWFAKRSQITFHDPLAAASIFDDGILTTKKGTVSVETTSRELAGLTRFSAAKEGEDGPHEIAVDVDTERFFKRYFDTVSG